MKRVVTILIMLVLFIVTMSVLALLASGCTSRYEIAMQQRADMAQYLRRTYPDTWEDKLFQYDMQQLQLDEQRRQNAIRMFNYNWQQSQNRLYGNR